VCPSKAGGEKRHKAEPIWNGGILGENRWLKGDEAERGEKAKSKGENR
jgi:hypothetical protein